MGSAGLGWSGSVAFDLAAIAGSESVSGSSAVAGSEACSSITGCSAGARTASFAGADATDGTVGSISGSGKSGSIGDLLLAAVLELVVLRGVRVDTPDLGVDEGGAFAASRALDRLLAHRIGGRHVGAVDGHADDAVAAGPVGDVGVCHLEPDRHRDRIAVVLADEHHRQLVGGGEIHSLVKVALARGAISERA